MTTKYKNKNIEWAAKHINELIFQAANLENKNISRFDVYECLFGLSKEDYLPKEEQLMMRVICKYKGVKTQQIAEILNYSQRHVLRIIKSLVQKGNLIRVGSKKTGYWRLPPMPEWMHSDKNKQSAN